MDTPAYRHVRLLIIYLPWWKFYLPFFLNWIFICHLKAPISSNNSEILADRLIVLNDLLCCTFWIWSAVLEHIWKWLFGPRNNSSQAYIISMHFRHLCLFFRGMCVWESHEVSWVLKPRGNTSNEPRGPRQIADSYLSVSVRTLRCTGSCHFFLCVGEAPRSVCIGGLGMWGVLRGTSAVGGRSGVQGPDGCQGNICSTSWLGLISRNAATHTGWEKGHSLQSLRKHACFCLSCKQEFGSLSGRVFAFHKAQRFLLSVIRFMCHDVQHILNYFFQKVRLDFYMKIDATFNLHKYSSSVSVY